MQSSEIQKAKHFESESIRLQAKGSKVAVTQMSISIIGFIDRDTNMYVAYAPSLEVSGYGNTIAEANEMIKTLLDEIMGKFSMTPLKKIHEELEKLGWKRNPFHHKNYSRAYIDIKGELKGFNVDLDTVIQSTLVTA